MAQNAILCAVNRFDAGTYFEGPDETLRLDFVNDEYGIYAADATSLPVSNLADRQLSKVWRTLNLDKTFTWFRCNFGAVRQIDVVSLLAHNGSSTAKWRIRLSNDETFATSLYDSGYINMWPTTASFGVKPWGIWQWGDPLGAFEVPTDVKPHAILVLPASISAQYMRIDIDDELNTAGYFEAGRCYAGPKYQPSKNIGLGWEIGWDDKSEIDYSLGGQDWPNELPRRRIVKVSFEFLDQAEAYLNLFEYVDRRKGVVGDILFIPQPDRTDFYFYEVIYGRMKELGPQAQPYHDVVTKTYVIEEKI